MYGHNKVRHQEHIKNAGRNYYEDKLQVQSIFYTLQGEGPYAGHPAVFVRLTGCNLRCTFCDTAWDDDNDPEMTAREVMEEIHRIRGPAKLVVVTGGEPLRQDLRGLFYCLREPPNRPGFDVMKIQIETAGTLWQDSLYTSGVEIVVSPKTPKILPEIYLRARAFKYVIRKGYTADDDGLPAMWTQRLMWEAPADGARLARPRPGAPVYLSPCDETGVRDVVPILRDGKIVPPPTTEDNQAEVVRLAMKHGYIAGTQLHKLWSVP